MLVAAGGFLGAVFRFGISQWVKRHSVTSFPLATLFVNIAGSFLLGWITGTEPSDSIRLFFGIGFMGAFTTFSTLKLENIQFYRKKQWDVLILYLALTYIVGILAALAGFLLGSR